MTVVKPIALVHDDEVKRFSREVSFALSSLSSGPASAGGSGYISNLEPSPIEIHYANRMFPIAYVGASESCALYIRTDPSDAEKAHAGLYIEIPKSQKATYASGIKIISEGHGDANYVALFGSNAAAYEGASFAPGTLAFIGTIQVPGNQSVWGQQNCVMFEALWGSAGNPYIGVKDGSGNFNIPNYGMFYAANSPANALLIQKWEGGVNSGDANISMNGYTQIRIVENDLSRNRFAVYNEGRLDIQSLAATAGVTLNDSPEFHMIGSAWSAGALDKSCILVNHVTAPGANEFRISLGSVGTETLCLRLTSANQMTEVNELHSQASADLQLFAQGAMKIWMKAAYIDFQTNGVQNIGGITMVGGGGNVDMQGGHLINWTTNATATAGAATLPAQPAGFFVVVNLGVTYKVPYYAA